MYNEGRRKFMTFAIKKKKCYELDSFDFGRMP